MPAHFIADLLAIRPPKGSWSDNSIPAGFAGYLREKAGMDLGDRKIESLLEQHRGEDGAEKWAAKS